MLKHILAVAGTVALTAGLGLAMATAPASASSLPVVYGMPYAYGALHPGISNFHGGKVRPTGELVWTGDGSGLLFIHSYSSYSSSGAWASATMNVRICWGSCMTNATEPVTLHFYRVETHNGQKYFTRLAFYLRHKIGGLGSSILKFYPSGTPAWYY